MSAQRIPRVRAYRWRDWAISIESAYDLENAGMTPRQVVPFVDASEVVEYVLPNSLLSNHFPTRLDISLAILFEHSEKLFALGPHARELDGVRKNWADRTRLISQELDIIRERYDDPDKVDHLRAELQKLSSAEAKDRATDLVRLIKENHRWMFAAWRVPLETLPGFFDQLRKRLRVPSREELEVPDPWLYDPESSRVDEWMDRLDDTEAGKGEPAPNLIDAYAIDQLEQIANAQDSRLIPILLTHSGKILEAVRKGREGNPQLLRKRGISLVQPTQVALVWHLKEEARGSNTLAQLIEELERQRERGSRIGALVDEVTSEDSSKQIYEERRTKLQQEIRDLDKATSQWEALQKIRQNLEPSVDHRKRGILQELEKLLEQGSNQQLEETLKQELNKLIEIVDRLQGQIANRLLPPEPPAAAIELDNNAKEIRAILSSPPTPLDRPRRLLGAIPSASYPIGFFRFRDPAIAPHLKRMASTLEALKSSSPKGSAPEKQRESFVRLWEAVSQLEDLQGRHEYYLLLAVAYLGHEGWFQAYDMAGEGIARIRENEPKGKGSVSHSVVRSELLLVRAAAARAWAHASRVGLPIVCGAFLSRAANNCLSCLESQREGWQQNPSLFPVRGLDARCLRELAVIIGSSREQVYGTDGSLQSINLGLDRARLSEWTPLAKAGSPLDLCMDLARQAYESGAGERQGGTLYINTYLYALTELDRRDLETGNLDSRRDERIELASKIETSGSGGDPNFLDTLMWHEYILALGSRRRGETWQEEYDKAKARGNDLRIGKIGNANYYKRLLSSHLLSVRGFSN